MRTRSVAEIHQSESHGRRSCESRNDSRRTGSPRSREMKLRTRELASGCSQLDGKRAVVCGRRGCEIVSRPVLKTCATAILVSMPDIYRVAAEFAADIHETTVAGVCHSSRSSPRQF